MRLINDNVFNRPVPRARASIRNFGLYNLITPVFGQSTNVSSTIASTGDPGSSIMYRELIAAFSTVIAGYAIYRLIKRMLRPNRRCRCALSNCPLEPDPGHAYCDFCGPTPSCGHRCQCHPDCAGLYCGETLQRIWPDLDETETSDPGSDDSPLQDTHQDFERDRAYFWHNFYSEPDDRDPTAPLT